MSVATEFVPEFAVPPRVVPRRLAPARPVPEPVAPVGTRPALASVRVLQSPVEVARPALRLTARGVAVLAAAVVLLGIALVWLARASAPSASAPRGVAPQVVTVRAGDTLWQIASRVAPSVDPRDEVARLEKANGLTGVDLVPGEQLRVP